MPDVSGDIFSRAVVLIIDHNEEGAFGLVLNKKNGYISQNLRKRIGFNIEIYEGGPVENNKAFFIVKGQPLNEFTLKINDDFYFTEDAETIIGEATKNRLDPSHIKIFSGYSGWVAKQLENEIRNHYWAVVDTLQLDYTSPCHQDLWKNIMQNLGGQFLLWANMPQDVSMN